MNSTTTTFSSVTNVTTTSYFEADMSGFAALDRAKPHNRVIVITTILSLVTMVLTFLGVLVRREKFPFNRRPLAELFLGLASMMLYAVAGILFAGSTIDCLSYKLMVYASFPMYALSFSVYAWQGVATQVRSAALLRLQRIEELQFHKIMRACGVPVTVYSAEGEEENAPSQAEEDASPSFYDRFVLGHPATYSPRLLVPLTGVMWLVCAALFFMADFVISPVNAFGVSLANAPDVIARVTPAVCSWKYGAYPYAFLLAIVIIIAVIAIVFHRKGNAGGSDQLRLIFELKYPVVVWFIAYALFMVIGSEAIDSPLYPLPGVLATWFHALMIGVPILFDWRRERQREAKMAKKLASKTAKAMKTAAAKPSAEDAAAEPKTPKSPKNALNESGKRKTGGSHVKDGKTGHAKKPKTPRGKKGLDVPSSAPAASANGRKTPSNGRKTPTGGRKTPTGEGRKSGQRSAGGKTPRRRGSSAAQQAQAQAAALQQARPGGKLEKLLREDIEFSAEFRRFMMGELQLASLLFVELAGAYRQLVTAKNNAAAEAVLERMMGTFVYEMAPMRADLASDYVGAVAEVYQCHATRGERGRGAVKWAAALARLNELRWGLLAQIEAQVLPRFRAAGPLDMDVDSSLESGSKTSAGGSTVGSESEYAGTDGLLNAGSLGGSDARLEGTYGTAYGDVPLTGVDDWENQYDQLPKEMVSSLGLPASGGGRLGDHRASSVRRRKRLAQSPARRQAARSKSQSKATTPRGSSKSRAGGKPSAPSPTTRRRRASSSEDVVVGGTDVVCYDCERPAVEACQECGHSLCRKCSAWRHRKGLLQKHHRHDVTDVSTAAAMGQFELCDDCEALPAERDCAACGLKYCKQCDRLVHTGLLTSHLGQGGPTANSPNSLYSTAAIPESDYWNPPAPDLLIPGQTTTVETL